MVLHSLQYSKLKRGSYFNCIQLPNGRVQKRCRQALSSSRKRGNSPKLQQSKFCKSTGKKNTTKKFVVRVGKYWNGLSREVKESLSVEIISIQLDKHLSNAYICILEIAISLQACQQLHCGILPGLCRCKTGGQRQGSQSDRT